MHYYPFNIADFRSHTDHLTLEEEAVYRRLLDYYYDTEQPIPAETQPVIRRLRLGSYSDTVRLILEEFFVLQDDGWHNLRADFEIAAYHEKASRARENGKKGGRPKKNKMLAQNPEKTNPVSSGFENKTQKKANQEPITNNQEDISSRPEGGGNRAHRYTDEDMRLAEYLFNKICEAVPHAKQPNLNKWADSVRLMRERDGLTHRRIAEVFKWANEDSFWRTNILSPDKLREKFPQLAAKRDASQTAAPAKPGRPGIGEIGDFGTDQVLID